MSKKIKIPKPLHDRLLITLDKPERKTAGGLYLPDSCQEMQTEGLVVAIGPRVGKNSVGPVPKVGDRVKFGEHAGTEIQEDGKEYLIMRESDIYAII